MDDLTDEERLALNKLAKRFDWYDDYQIAFSRRKRRAGRLATKNWGSDEHLRLVWLRVEYLRQIHNVSLAKIKVPLLVDAYGWKDTGPIELTADNNVRTVRRLYYAARRRMKADPNLAHQWARDLEDAKRWGFSSVKIRFKDGIRYPNGAAPPPRSE